MYPPFKVIPAPKFFNNDPTTISAPTFYWFLFFYKFTVQLSIIIIISGNFDFIFFITVSSSLIEIHLLLLYPGDLLNS